MCDPHAAPAPSNGRCIYGYVLALVSIAGLLLYLIWAFVPSQLFHSFGITYLPSKYWSLAFPVFVCTGLFLFSTCLYPAVNLLFTPPLHSNLLVISAFKDLKCDIIYAENFNYDCDAQFKSIDFRSHLSEWINKLGEESAKAQSLKVPITSYEKFTKSDANDRIYLLLNCETPSHVSINNISAVGMIRIGVRHLYLEHNDQLKHVQNCMCLLDFYVSRQRRGYGYFLLSQVIQHLNISAQQLAYDRPTTAMISFLKRHFNLHPPLEQHNHFRNIPSDCVSLSGTRMSPKGMMTLTSTGIPSLDMYLGGGVPINSITIIENDKHSQYSNMLMKSFIAEGLVYDHQIIISSPKINSLESRLLKELPMKNELRKEDLTSDESMKIAWRYQSLPSVTSNQSHDQFDFSTQITNDKLSNAKIHFVNHMQCLKSLETYSFGNSVTRIIIEGLAPLSELPIEEIPKFIYKLKSLVRRLTNVVCLVMLTPIVSLSDEYTYIRSRIRNIVDCVIELVSFDDSTHTQYTDYNGLINIHKLPKLNSLNYYFLPETFDLGFQLKKNYRFFIVDKLCLPPDLSENVSRTSALTSCSTVNKILDF